MFGENFETYLFQMAKNAFKLFYNRSQVSKMLVLQENLRFYLFSYSQHFLVPQLI